MMRILYVLLFCIFFSTLGNSQVGVDHCDETEKNLFSFFIEDSDKMMSICIGQNDSYIACRFGFLDSVEFTYPAVLNDSSWNNFEYSGYYRGGGKANKAMNDQMLSFERDSQIYQIYDVWAYEDETDDSFFRETGFNIFSDTETIEIKADSTSVKGWFAYLSKSNKIMNSF